MRTRRRVKEERAEAVVEGTAACMHASHECYCARSSFLHRLIQAEAVVPAQHALNPAAAPSFFSPSAPQERSMKGIM